MHKTEEVSKHLAEVGIGALLKTGTSRTRT